MPTYQTPGVYIEEVKASGGALVAGDTAVAAFVGFTERAPKPDSYDDTGLKPRKVTNWTEFTDLYGGFKEHLKLPHAVYGYFLNGGSKAYIVRIPHRDVSDDPGVKALGTGDPAIEPPIEFTAKKNGTVPLDDVNIEVKAKGTKSDTDLSPTYDIRITGNGDVTESYEAVTLGDLKAKLGSSTLVSVDVKSKTEVDALAKELQTIPVGSHPIVPKDGDPKQSISFTGSAAKREGINGLAIADDVTMVMVPDLVTAASNFGEKAPDLDMWKSVQLAVINHCELEKNRMAVLDAPPGMSPQQVLEWKQKSGYSSMFATLYYPWITVDNPIGTNGNKKISVPPSGHVAGLWANTDATRGVWKAPANEVLRGALEVERDITKVEQSDLNPVGINCIRPFAGRGIRVWGARTLSDTDEWKYLNVRRLFNMIEAAIEDGTQFAVFEPNDQRLWSGLTRTVSSFLRGLWRDGALFGATEQQAFYVKCDAETNPPDQVNNGIVMVEVGIAPVKPAEFVVFRIAQIQDDPAGGGEE